MTTYTISQLQNMLEERQGKLKTLASQRQELLTQLKSVDSEIEKLAGESVNETLSHIDIPKAAAKKKKVPAGKKKTPSGSKRTTALDYAKDVLRKHPDGLDLDKLASKILESGYETSSNNFKTVLYQSLYKAKDEVQRDGDRYKLI